MRKQLNRILPALLIFVGGSSFGQWNQSQYFDGADSNYYYSIFVHIDTTANNIWQIGKPQKVIFDSAATYRNAIVTDTVNNYPVNNLSSFTFDALPYMAYGVLGLQWKQKLNMQKKHAGGIVEFSTDYGVTWQNAFNNPYVYNFFGFPAENQDTLLTGEYAFSGTDSTWEDVWLCYNLSWMGSTADSVKVRFTFKSDSSAASNEGWMIDNLNVHVTIIHPVKEVEGSDYFNVYPNPAKNILHIELKSLHEFHIIENMQLVNAEGKLVQEWRNIPVRFWIDTSKYPNGMYYLKIKSNIKSKTIPVLIQR
jgi:hypothetical protein